VDRLAHRGLWCNFSGAGIGAPPQAAPAGYAASHLDAFVWVKPPGESDGASKDIPNDEGKHADPMCNPDYTRPQRMPLFRVGRTDSQDDGMTITGARSPGRPTLEEVAVRAGVGRGTVSRVINGSVQVSSHARSAVRRAIDELGYVPNRAAEPS
jgi:hypothetical protein